MSYMKIMVVPKPAPPEETLNPNSQHNAWVRKETVVAMQAPNMVNVLREALRHAMENPTVYMDENGFTTHWFAAARDILEKIDSVK